MSIFNSAQTQWVLNFLKILIFQKFNLCLKVIFAETELQKKTKFDIFQKPIFFTLASSRNFALKVVSSATGQYM